MVDKIIFECENCPYWRRTDREVYGECLKNPTVIINGKCKTMDDLKYGRKQT